jgi:hypothetical protein
MPVTIRILNNGEIVPSGSFSGATSPIVYPDQVYVFASITNAGQPTTLTWEFSFNGGSTYGTPMGNSESSVSGTGTQIYYGNAVGISGITGTIYYRVKATTNGITITSDVKSLVK